MGAVQVYKVPEGITSGAVLIGVTVKGLPVQIAAVLFAIIALGFTVTVTVNVFVHVFGVAPEVAVTV